MPETLCFQVPADHELETIDGWSRIDSRTYSAVRAHIVVIKRRGTKLFTGPTLRRIDVPAGSEYVVKRRDIVTVKHTAEIQRSVQQTVTDRITQEFSQKIAAEISASGALPSAKATSETQFKAIGELTNAVQQSLNAKRAFEVQLTQEDERSIAVKTRSDGSRAPAKHLHLYVGVWPWRWDFYLYKVEILRLRYEKRWIWPDVRETFSSRVLTLKQPLFSVQFYEPQEDFSISDGDHAPEIEDPEAISIAPLTVDLPNVEFPLNPTLEGLARLAFPVTGQERREAASRRASRVIARKPAAAKPAAKRTPAGRAMVGRGATGKARPKMTTAKKPAVARTTAKRSTARKPAATTTKAAKKAATAKTATKRGTAGRATAQRGGSARAGSGGRAARSAAARSRRR
ncbi:MAG: hypothetical protein IRZ13_19995 [Acetobacteraceae bacterium]|nr:hypothetical protein [Acetobacteraceae bacterium]